jgi:hypothetical protein
VVVVVELLSGVWLVLDGAVVDGAVVDGELVCGYWLLDCELGDEPV